VKHISAGGVSRNMSGQNQGCPIVSKKFLLGAAVGLFSGYVLFVSLPAFIKAHSTSACNACVNNLRQIDAAANQYALEHSLTNGSPIAFPSDLTPYIKLNSAGKIPGCPQGGVYHISKVGETPACSLGATVTPAHVLP
jgi:hypothetical protein